MSRSVVLGKSIRCERCRFSPRWCICEAFQAVRPALGVNVLIHQREFWRPTSTGRLIQRVIPETRFQVYQHDVPLKRNFFVPDDVPLWILHPFGEPISADSAPINPQVLLLDGSWREATRMMHEVHAWGRLVSLPMSGPSRFWLRGQQGEGNYSTIEALLFLMQTLGLQKEYEQLRLQFELHVYAGLRTRGDKQSADEYLLTSPVREAFPELLAKLAVRRPRIY